MKKIITTGIIASVLATSVLSAPKKPDIKIGYGSLGFGSNSSSAFNIGMEASLKNTEKMNYHFNLEAIKSSDATMTFFGLGARYKINDKTGVGLNAGVSGLALDGTSSSETDFQGFVLGVDAKYKLAKHHSLVADYKSGTLTDDTGNVDIDVDAMSLSYVYNF